MNLQCSLVLIFYCTLVACQKITVMKHEFNINDLGQRTARKIQQLPQPPFTMNVIHSKDRMYTSKGDQIVPYFPTYSRTFGNRDRGENKPEKQSMKNWNALIPGRVFLPGQYQMPASRATNQNNFFPITAKRGVGVNWDKSKFGDDSGYLDTWGSSHPPRQHNGDSTNGNQNQNEQDVVNILEGTSIKRIIKSGALVLLHY
jgi:hypothetical protein